MRVLLIRHGATESNAARRYLGRRDEPLCREGIAQALDAAEKGLPPVQKVFASPMLRCIQTAQVLFPETPMELITDFMELHFGRFEGKTYEELLASEPSYQAWLDSKGLAPIPEGESMEHFMARIRRGWEELLSRAGELSSVAAVVHGGVIMALQSLYCDPPKAFYDGAVKNCEALDLLWDEAHLRPFPQQDDGGAAS